MYRILIFPVGIIIALLSSCANQVAPTGGPKDEIPPLLISSTPQQGQLRFSEQEIILNFDELVVTNNPKEQFIITPRPQTEYEVKYRKNRVIISFEEPLEDSTTYSINFREGIKDITEGNAADTLRLAFSTGTFLDSLSISGKITDLMSNKPAEDVMVSLYRKKDTLDVFNSPPVYFAKTNTDGTYRFENLKNGTYKIYALADKNKNLMLDSKSEKYGFLSRDIKLDSSLTGVDFPVQFLDVRELEIQSARQSGSVYILKFNKHVTDYRLDFADTVNLYSNFTDNQHSSIQLFKPLNYSDSIRIQLSATDSIQNVVRDTLYAKFDPERKPLKFTADFKLQKIITANPAADVTVKFNKPIRAVNYDSLYIYLDSTNIINVSREIMEWNTTRDQVIIRQQLNPDLFETPSQTAPQSEPKEPAEKPAVQDTSRANTPKAKPKKPHFYSGWGAFVSAELDSSEQKNPPLSFVKPPDLGTILVEVQTDKESYTVQLLNKQQVIAEVQNGRKFEFKYIEPGEYRIRVLVDINNNGEWDPGNIKLEKEPEPVVFYQNEDGIEVLTVRANWEVGPYVISF